MKQNVVRLGQEKINKLLLRLSFPAVVGMVANALYNLVDTIFVGRGVGSLAIGALAIAFPLQMLIVAIAQTVGLGAGSAVSRNLGAGKIDRAKCVVGNSFFCVITLAFTVSAIGLSFIEQILIFFGATQTILPYAHDYVVVILWGLPFFSFAISSNNLIRAEGNAKAAMISMLIGAILNIILDPIYIFVFNLGIKGAALATITAQFCSFLFIIYYIYKKDTFLKIKLRHLKPNLEIIKEIITVGLPSFLRLSSGSIATLLVNQSLRFYGGDLAIIILGVVIKITRFLFMPMFGVVQGMQPIAGYNYGARQYDRVLEVLKLTIKVLLIMSTSICLLMIIWPAKVIGIFTTDLEVIQAGMPVMRLLLFSIPILSIQMTGATLFQALGKAAPAIVFSLLRRVLLFIPLIIALPRFTQLGLMGIWLSYPIADILSAVITWFFLRSEIRKIRYEAEIFGV
ncbi:MAG: MATE family efflux transporter [Atribacterota bacterium]|nr:MATE family efflux transporter [Atribacterota bacterium]MDD4764782.1 MATE family efflux transporter [Atribacterota bacterium]MDD5635685.1 MATE family efflux transporter [Atribacterota bacterium]